jgi:flagellar hook-basal body complex protein FliE
VTVEPLLPDVPPVEPSPRAGDASSFTRALDALGAMLGGAENAEDAFARGTGTLQDAVYERARADVALSVATAAAQRCAQAVTSILNMQV